MLMGLFKYDMGALWGMVRELVQLASSFWLDHALLSHSSSGEIHGTIGEA